MSIDNPNSILLGSKRFQGASDVDMSEKITLEQTSHEQIEYERYIDVNLLTVFDRERQVSDTFRPVGKYNLIFKNAYQGYTNYEPYYNYLYYSNLIQNTQNVLCFPGVTPTWSGFPQYSEFDFIRTDNDKVGYTTGPGNHLEFVNKSASTYNWNHYLSYAFDNDYNKILYTNDPELIITWYWLSGDGIPFYIKEVNNEIISFKSPIKHGMNEGEYVQLSLSYNGNTLFPIASLGDGGSGSDEYIFNINNVGYIGGVFSVGIIGTAKRVLDPENSGETTSKYYIRRHKILTNSDDAVLVNSGYEQNIFNLKTQYEKVYSGGTPLTILSPPSCPRTSTLEGSQSYTLSFNSDVTLTGLIDNQKRPITEVFFTTIWKGYYGWTNKLKEGHYFNAYLDGDNPNVWWDTNNTLSDSTIPFGTYFPNNPNAVNECFYTQNLSEGDIIDGDFCEWNDYEQLERVASPKIHKFTFNQNYFTPTNNSPSNNKYGYYYFPLSSLQLKVYSEYVEEGNAGEVDNIPNYAFYSNKSNGFRWRDIYPYGFVDNEGLGVDYPFTNGKHYPFKNIIFRVFSEGTGVQDITLIQDPTVDECE
jgi:hypothetical protein